MGDTKPEFSKIFCVLFCSYQKKSQVHHLIARLNPRSFAQVAFTMSKTAVITASVWAAGSVVLAAYIITLSKDTISCCLATQPLSFNHNSLANQSARWHGLLFSTRVTSIVTERGCKQLTSCINDNVF